MSFTTFIKAAFAFIYGYDVDAEVAAAPPEWQQRELVPCHAFGYAPLPSEDDLTNGFQPYYSLSGYVPSRTMSLWRQRRFAAI